MNKLKDMTRIPAVAHAKEMAKRLGASGVIIIAFSDATFAGASYGQTKRKCTALKAVLDDISDGLTTGDIKVPKDFYDGTDGR